MADDDAKKNAAAEVDIEIWKIKKLIKKLEEARGCARVCYTSAATHACSAYGLRLCVHSAIGALQQRHEHDLADPATQVSNIRGSQDACR